MGITQITAPMSKFQSRLAASEKTGFAAKVNQFGINMVDLMMWLVIAALLLAAALQGIGFYQKAAWNYQLNSDASSLRTYMEAQYTLQNNVYPTQTQVAASITAGELKMTADGGVSNKVSGVADDTKGGWVATICSAPLFKAQGAAAKNAISIQSADSSVKTQVVVAAC